MAQSEPNGGIQEIERLRSEVRTLKEDLGNLDWAGKKTNDAVKILYKELEKKNQELEKLSQIKSHLVSIVSHDLRNPVGVIMAAADIILDGLCGPLTPDQKKWVERIRQRGAYILEMADKILDFSKLDAGNMNLKKEIMDTAQLLRSLVSNIHILAQNKGISLKHNIQLDLPPIWADATRIEQVVTNLVGNAMKFTPPGGTIEVSAKKDKDPSYILISVSDTGPGIAPEYHKVIFDRFQQLDTPQQGQKEEKGVGLGLSICQQIVHLHDGQIWVESEVGKGSSFIFKLPVSSKSRPESSPSILVVDDEEEIGKLFDRTLASENYPHKVFKSSSEALEYIRSGKNPISVAFLDLKMPRANGVEVVKVLRKSHPYIPIVIITAYPESDLLIQVMEYGPFMILGKPFGPEAIRQTIKTFF